MKTKLSAFVALLCIVIISSCRKDISACFNASTTTPSVGQSVSFTSCSTGGSSYDWDFADGSSGSGETTSHTFTSAGTYNVKLTVKNGNRTAIAAQTIIVSSGSTTVTLQPDATSGIDAGLSSYYPSTNYGATYPEITALSGTSGGSNILIRSVFMFDLSAIASTKTVTSAKLTLYGGTDPVNGTNSMSGTANASYIQRITSTWTELGVTWNNQPSTTTTNEVALPTTTIANKDFIDIDVTNLVKDMVSNPSTSFGFELVLQNESGYNSMQFASSDCTDATKRPKLVVVYK